MDRSIEYLEELRRQLAEAERDLRDQLAAAGGVVLPTGMPQAYLDAATVRAYRREVLDEFLARQSTGRPVGSLDEILADSHTPEDQAVAAFLIDALLPLDHPEIGG